MKRPASVVAAQEAPSPTKPAITSIRWEATFDAEVRQRFEAAVQAAREHVDVPAWVEGPRPSDECIALHHGCDPHDQTVHTYSEEASMRSRKEPYSFDLLYKLPETFREEQVDAAGVRCFWTNWPGTSSSKGVLIFFHGGAFTTGTVSISTCARLSCLTGLRVLTVDYRLAPEHPMPAATEDCLRVYRWLIEEQRVLPQKIALMGTSAGGALVVLLLQELRKQGLSLPACGVPISAWRPHFTQDERWQITIGNRTGSGEITGRNLDVDLPQFNFLSGDFRGLPPLYVMVGGTENIERDVNASKCLATLAHEAGVEVHLDVVRNVGHTPNNYLFVMPEATACVARAASFIHRAFESQCPSKQGSNSLLDE